MSLLAIIPIWMGCLLCYLGSTKQQALTKSISKKVANTSLITGYVLGSFLFATHFPIASSLLAALVVLMLALVSHTIVSVYFKSVWLFNGLVIATLCVLAGMNYVA